RPRAREYTGDVAATADDRDGAVRQSVQGATHGRFVGGRQAIRPAKETDNRTVSNRGDRNLLSRPPRWGAPVLTYLRFSPARHPVHRSQAEGKGRSGPFHRGTGW